MSIYKFDDLPRVITDLVREIQEMKTLIASGAQNHTLKPTPVVEETLSIQEAAEYLKCTKQTIHRMKKTGKLKFHKFGRIVWFLKSDILEASLVDLRKQRRAR